MAKTFNLTDEQVEYTLQQLDISGNTLTKIAIKDFDTTFSQFFYALVGKADQQGCLKISQSLSSKESEGNCWRKILDIYQRDYKEALNTVKYISEASLEEALKALGKFRISSTYFLFVLKCALTPKDYKIFKENLALNYSKKSHPQKTSTFRLAKLLEIDLGNPEAKKEAKNKQNAIEKIEREKAKSVRRKQANIKKTSVGSERNKPYYPCNETYLKINGEGIGIFPFRNWHKPTITPYCKPTSYQEQHYKTQNNYEARSQ